MESDVQFSNSLASKFDLSLQRSNLLCCRTCKYPYLSKLNRIFDILHILGSASAVKLVDRETLLKEREAKKAFDAEKSAEKERKRLEVAAAQAAKDVQRKIDPKEMFLSETEKYSAFDENVCTICYKVG